MKRTGLILIVLLLAVSCIGGPRLIPKKTFTKIYIDMFLAGEWLESHKEAREVADTTLFYEAVFNKYGYTTEDYYHSVSKYLSDPGEYAKILKEASAVLEDTYTRLQKEEHGEAGMDEDKELPLRKRMKNKEKEKEIEEEFIY